MVRTLPAPRAGVGARARGQRALSGLLVLTLVSMLAAMAAVGVSPAATGAQDDALETATVTPETVLFYAAVNLDTASDQYDRSKELLDRSGLTDLFASQAGDEFSDDDLAELEPFLGGEAALVVTGIPDELSLDELTGSLAGAADPEAAVADMTETASLSGVALVVRAADPDAAFAKAEELQAEAADEAGAVVETTEYEGVEISYFAGTDVDASDPTALARVGDFVVVAASPTDVEPIVDVEGGRTPSLAESDDFSTLQGELNDEFVLWAYVNGPGFKEAVEAGAASEDLEGAEFLFGDGLAALEAYTGAVVYATDVGFRLDTISIPTNDAPIPGGDNFDATLDERVPGDTLLFVNGMDLGANPLLQAVGLILAQAINGEEPGVMPEGVDLEEYAEQQYAQAADLLGFNLKTDLLDQLTGEFVIALSVSNLLSPEGIGGVIASGVTDPAAVAEAVERVALMVASATTETMTASSREIGDDTVNVVEDTSSGFPLRVEYGVVGDELVIGLGSGLEQFVEGPDESLADNPTYQAVMAELPAEHGASAYLDLAQVISFLQFFLGTATGDTGLEDASPECANYESQEEAQAAYDENPGALIDLDQDFDGEACEDYFADEAGTAPAGPPDLSAITALGFVQYERDGLSGSSTILYIAE